MSTSVSCFFRRELRTFPPCLFLSYLFSALLALRISSPIPCLLIPPCPHRRSWGFLEGHLEPPFLHSTCHKTEKSSTVHMEDWGAAGGWGLGTTPTLRAPLWLCVQPCLPAPIPARGRPPLLQPSQLSCPPGWLSDRPSTGQSICQL